MASVLISNGTGGTVSISHLGNDGEFVVVGAISAEKRLSFTDVAGSVWKVSARGGSGRETIFKTGTTNSHFIFCG